MVNDDLKNILKQFCPPSCHFFSYVPSLTFSWHLPPYFAQCHSFFCFGFFEVFPYSEHINLHTLTKLSHLMVFVWAVSNQSGFVSEPRDNITSGTLDRNRRSTSGVSYPLYHTCNRPNSQAKKKVTILDNDGKIGDGSKV